ncbi:MAG: 2-hydroxyacyl-CoA dehydratase, partial [Bacillota bacterium]
MEWKYRLIKAGLHTAVIYRLAELGVRLVDKGYRKQALLYLLEETRAAYKHQRPVVWCSTFVPSELVYALGGVPFMPEVAAGFSAAAGLGDELITRAEGDWLNPDLCSIHRSGTGLKKAGLLPEPDLMIASAHLCDGAKKYLQQLAREYDCPFYLLETPYSSENRDWLARQIREIAGEISQGAPEFEQVFNLSNRAYTYHQQVNQLRRQKPAFFSGEQSMNLVPME